MKKVYAVILGLSFIAHAMDQHQQQLLITKKFIQNLHQEIKRIETKPSFNFEKSQATLVQLLNNEFPTQALPEQFTRILTMLQKKETQYWSLTQPNNMRKCCYIGSMEYRNKALLYQLVRTRLERTLSIRNPTSPRTITMDKE